MEPEGSLPHSQQPATCPYLRDNLSVPSPKSKSPLKIGPIGCPETPVQNYYSKLRNIPNDADLIYIAAEA
jgi:hypothetical protein